MSVLQQTVAQLGANFVLVIVFFAWVYVLLQVTQSFQKANDVIRNVKQTYSRPEIDAAVMPRASEWQYTEQFFAKIEEFRSEFS